MLHSCAGHPRYASASTGARSATPVPDEVKPVLANSALSAAAAVAALGAFLLSLLTFVFGRG